MRDRGRERRRTLLLLNPGVIYSFSSVTCLFHFLLRSFFPSARFCATRNERSLCHCNDNRRKRQRGREREREEMIVLLDSSFPQWNRMHASTPRELNRLDRPRLCEILSLWATNEFNSSININRTANTDSAGAIWITRFSTSTCVFSVMMTDWKAALLTQRG